MLRSANLQNAQTDIFDVCIIGGGATGAGCALDAALRGLKVILVETEDFSSATSGKSTKLIHGGVRYLEQAVKKLSLEQFKMVKKGLKERKTLLQLAPHLTSPISLITPVKNNFAGLYYFIGLKVYDMLSGNQTLGPSKWLNKTSTLQKIPTLKSDFASAIMYYDGQIDDQRYGMALIQTACKNGAIALNHTRVEAFEKNEAGELIALKARNMLNGENIHIKAKSFINATGPFSDHIRLMANNSLQPRVRVSKGVHIILPKEIMPSKDALLIPETADGRLVFAIPYQNYLLVGTTEDETTLTEEEFGPTQKEIEYILKYVNQYLEGNITANQVKAGFGGLRPLVQANNNSSTKELVRDHIIETDNSSKLISILGGKWTTYRLMAKDTLDVCEMQLKGTITACTTHQKILEGGQNFSANLENEILSIIKLPDDVVDHLLSKYGDKAPLIALIATKTEKLSQRIITGAAYTYAELLYVMENEMACTIKDVVARRFGAQLLNWQQTLELIPLVGNEMAIYFSWTEKEKQGNINLYLLEMQAMIKDASLTI